MSSRAGCNVSISLLGGFEARARGGRLELPVTAQRVVGFLAVVGKRQSREVVAGRLWSFTTQTRAQANLRTALWQLRQVHDDLVQSAHGSISLGEGVAIDYRLMTDQARLLLSGGIAEGGLLHVPLDLFQAELLPGWDEEWLIIDRERHRQLRMHALEELSHRLVDLRQFALAVEAAYAAIAVEPLSESAHRTLTWAFLAEGNRRQALRQLNLYRELLIDETGLAPSDDFVALLDRTSASSPQDPSVAGSPRDRLGGQAPELTGSGGGHQPFQGPPQPDP
jgi:DNA-binding SARP family transcriptional activator